jgi:peptidoglycan/xylan/chitin deacetylase (PgdA/CDA1 family)
MNRTFVLVVLSLLLFFLAAPVFAGEAHVFVYHRFGDGRYPSTNIALDTFAAQLQWLKKTHTTVLTLGQIVERLREDKPLPERCAALTVDDAFETFWTGARPLLRRYGFRATLFVSTDAVGGHDYLNWNQIRQLARDGVEIGSHTASHPYLLDRRRGEDEAQWQARVRRQILKAQRILTKELGRTPRLFAYPYGEYSPRLEAIVKKLGLAAAAAQQSGVVYRGSDRFALPRFPMGGPYATLKGFREKLAMRALPVTVVSPPSPVVGRQDPPTLTVQIAPKSGADLSRMHCYVQGQALGRITPDPKVAGRFTIRALEPLAGRRNKYTLTAPAKRGRGWYWFSQLWVMPGK